jgi:hypothetical protein
MPKKKREIAEDPSTIALAAIAPFASDAIDASNAPDESIEPDSTFHEDRRWRDNGWTAQVLKNEDDDGWAVSMTPDGQSEPALIGPWTMGRDKKNPKPLDTNAFHTLVKTAGEFVCRQEQQLHASLHRSVEIAHGEGRITVTLDIEPDEDNPRATLSAVDTEGTQLASQRVPPGFNLTRASAAAWAQAGFER